LQECLDANDGDLLARYRAYAISLGRDKPGAMTWTGAFPSDDRRCRVVKWIEAEVLATALYTKGISPDLRPLIDNCAGRLIDIAAHAPEYPEFKLHREPEGDSKRFIGVISPHDATSGRVEVVDGVHRAVTLIYRRHTSLPAYIALTRD